MLERHCNRCWDIQRCLYSVDTSKWNSWCCQRASVTRCWLIVVGHLLRVLLILAFRIISIHQTSTTHIGGVVYSPEAAINTFPCLTHLVGVKPDAETKAEKNKKWRAAVSRRPCSSMRWSWTETEALTSLSWFMLAFVSSVCFFWDDRLWYIYPWGSAAYLITAVVPYVLDFDLAQLHNYYALVLFSFPALLFCRFRHSY